MHERRLPEAIAVFDAAEMQGADRDRCAGARWLCWMMLGKFEQAWCESDAIRMRGAEDPGRFWDGSTIRGKRVMVRSLHGYGDAVQYLRYLPMLQSEASEVIVEVAPALRDLVQCLGGADRVITWGADAPREQPEWDTQVEVTELPYMFRSTTATLPKSVPYVHLPATLLAEAREQVAKARGLRVGLVWASSGWDATRCVPFPALDGLLSVDGVEFWSLQAEPENGPWRECCGVRRWPVRAGGEGEATRTAAFIAQMDLLISVDTFAAHLAGALGRPVWVLLKRAADWRWMLERADSPWYPTMRLFRAKEDGCWTSVLAEARNALERWRDEQEGGR